MTSCQRPDRLAAELVRPGALVALALLAVNDHLLKGAGVLPDAITGKLSDFAGLYIFPILLFSFGVALVRCCGGRVAPRRPLAIAAAAVTAAGFALVKLHPGANAALARMWGAMALDASDLVALPMCALAAYGLAREAPPPAPFTRRRPGRALRLGALAATLLACAATSPAPPRRYPAWTLQGTRTLFAGCARLETWVSKSGKEGFGVTVALRRARADTPCHVALREALFRVGATDTARAPLPGAMDLAAVDVFVYLPFAFDNQSLWNRSQEEPALRRGTVALALEVDGADGRTPERIELTVEQEWPSPHGRAGDRAPAHPPQPVAAPPPAPAAPSTTPPAAAPPTAAEPPN